MISSVYVNIIMIKWFLLRDVQEYLNENSLEDNSTIIHSIIQLYIVCYNLNDND